MDDRAWGIARGRLIVGFGFLLAVTIAVMAVPRLLAGWSRLVASAGISALYDGRPLTAAGYRRTVEGLEDSLRLHRDPATLGDLGLAYLSATQGWSGPIDVRFARLLDAGREALSAGLAMAPGEPNAWTHLAYGETLAGHDRPAVSALGASFRFGPYVPELAPSRSELCLVHRSELPEWLAAACAEELILALRVAPDRVVASALANSAVEIVRAASRGDAELLTSFEAALAAAVPEGNSTP